MCIASCTHHIPGGKSDPTLNPVMNFKPCPLGILREYVCIASCTHTISLGASVILHHHQLVLQDAQLTDAAADAVATATNGASPRNSALYLDLEFSFSTIFSRRCNVVQILTSIILTYL